MTNPYAEMVDPGGTNPYAALTASTLLDNQEIDVIHRTNNPTMETPSSFGLTEIPKETLNTITNSPLRYFKGIGAELIGKQGKDIGQLMVEAGNLAATGESPLMQSFTSRIYEHAINNDLGLFGSLRILWGVEKDALFGLLTKAVTPKLMQNMGNALIAGNQQFMVNLGFTRSGDSDVAFDLGVGTGQLAKQIFYMVATKSPELGMALMGASIQSDTYTEIKNNAMQEKKSFDPEKAAQIALADGAVQSMIFASGTGILLDVLKNNSLFKKVIFGGLEQSMVNMAAVTTNESIMASTDVRRTTFEEKAANVLYAGGLSLVLGMGAGGVGHIMQSAGRKENLPQKKIDEFTNHIIKKKDEIIDTAAGLIGKEMSGVTNDAPARADTLKAVQNVFANQAKVDEAMATGNTENPQIAAQVISKTASPETKDAITALGKNFTMEQLHAVVQGRFDEALRPILEQQGKAQQTKLEAIQSETDDIALNLQREISALRESKQPVNPETLNALETQASLLHERRMTPKPMGLTDFIKSIGGLKDFAGELKSIGANRLTKKTGISFDEAGQKAFEKGYFDQHPTVSEFLAALESDFKGHQKIISSEDMGNQSYLDHIDKVLQEVDRALGEHGIGTDARARLGELRKRIVANRKIDRALTSEVKNREMQLSKLETAKTKTQESPPKIFADKLQTFIAGLRKGGILQKMEIKDVQEHLINLIENSGLEANDKAKFLRTVKNTQTVEQLESRLPEIQDRVNNLIDTSQKREIKNSIKTLLGKTKTIRQSGKTVGKFADADLQSTLDRLRAATKMTSEQAANKIAENLSQAPTIDAALENSVLSVMTGDAPLSAMQETLASIDSMIKEGRAGKAESLLARKEQITETKTQVIDGVLQGRAVEDISKINLKDRLLKALNVIRSAESALNNGWFDTLDILLGKTSEGRIAREKLSEPIHKAIQQENGLITELGNNFVAKAKEIFGIQKNNALKKKFIKDERLVDLGEFSRDGQDQSEGFTPGKAVTWELSVAQGRKLWMELQDPTIRKTLIAKNGNGITHEMEEMLDPDKNDFLTHKDIEFAKAQMEFYKKIYPKMDAVYSKIKGVHLSDNPFYSPIRREHAETISNSNEFLQELQERQSAAPSSVKSRVRTNAKLIEQSDITAMLKNITQASHFISMAETARDLNSVFIDPNVRKSIDTIWGHGMLENIDGYIKDFTFGHIQRAETWMGLFDKLNSHFAKSVLGLKANMIPKQMSSIFAYATEIPIHQFTIGLADFAKHPVEAVRILSKSRLMMKRGSSQDVDIAKGAQQQSAKIFGGRDTLDEILMMPIKFGDRSAIYPGGWAIYKYNRDVLGKSHEASIAAFEKTTDETQQSSNLNQMSRFQASRNPFMRTLSMFMTAPNSYYRLEKRAIRQMLTGEISKAEAGKKIIILHLLLPALFQYIANGFEWDDKDELRAAGLGSLNGFMILGSVLESAIAKAQGIYYHDHGLNFIAGMQDLFDSGARSFRKGEIALSDILDAVGLISGLPLKSAENFAEGIKDVTQGNTAVGVKRITGYTEKIAKKKQKVSTSSIIPPPP